MYIYIDDSILLYYINVLYVEVCGNECSNSDVSRELRQERQMENMDRHEVLQYLTAPY